MVIRILILFATVADADAGTPARGPTQFFQPTIAFLFFSTANNSKPLRDTHQT
jgi:hypothetical protein